MQVAQSRGVCIEDVSEDENKAKEQKLGMKDEMNGLQGRFLRAMSKINSKSMQDPSC